MLCFGSLLPGHLKLSARLASLGTWRSQSPLPALPRLPAKQVWGRPGRTVRLGCPIPGATEHQLCEVLGSAGEKTSQAPNSVLDAASRPKSLLAHTPSCALTSCHEE